MKLAPSPRRGFGKLVLLVAIGAWTYLLYGFVSTGALILLCLVGPLLLVGGLWLAKAMGRHLLDSGWYIAGFLVGLLMLGVAAATLWYGAPDATLLQTTSGLEILEQRIQRLDRAITAGNLRVARRLAARGLGDSAPLDTWGRPVLHGVQDGALLSSLLESGLDPDARDSEGRTLLMQTHSPEFARILIAAGADIHARDRNGFTVADYHQDGPIRELVESHAGDQPLLERADADAMPSARIDWLRDDSAGAVDRSALTLDRQLRRGDRATVMADLVNASDRDQVIDVTAELNQAALFASASHGGSIANPVQPQRTQTIQWPQLALPARRHGRLELQFLTRSDWAAGDLAIIWRVRQVPSQEETTLQVYDRFDAVEEEGSLEQRVLTYAVAAAIVAGIGLLILRARALAARPDRGVEAAVGLTARLVAVLVACGALVILWSMVEPLVRFDQASCTILDRRIRTTRGGAPWALAAVRIEGGAAPVYATGFDVASNRSVQELKRFPLGARVPCWVDPELPSRLTLVRRPSMASVTTVVALPMAALLMAGLGRFLSRHAAAKRRHVG